MIKTLISAGLLTLLSTTAHATTVNTEKTTLQIDTITSGLKHPWGIRLLV